ncbi:MAG: hypothetical protein HKN26_10435, partial [Acidimicrobiales bacterium]|nr:hypothetical protein [Acidimicrobiales bacterium]
MNRTRFRPPARTEWFGIDWRAVLGSWILARIAVALGYAIADGRASDPPALTLDQGLLAWDGSWYQ